jgi:sulfite exporter TauE/SafE
MTAISPCPLAANITAIGFISKDIEDKKRIFINGLLYTLGRVISYSVLGVILFFGASKFELASFFQIYGEKILGPLLVIIGILMLDIVKIRIPFLGNWTEKAGQRKKKTGWSALLLGIIFALAFCPYSGVLYFGMLIPMSIAAPSGLFLPPVFAVATGLPVIIVAWILAYSVASLGNFYNKVRNFEKWFRRVVAVVFIIIGCYYIYIFFIAG